MISLEAELNIHKRELFHDFYDTFGLELNYSIYCDGASKPQLWQRLQKDKFIPAVKQTAPFNWQMAMPPQQLHKEASAPSLIHTSQQEQESLQFSRDLPIKDSFEQLPAIDLSSQYGPAEAREESPRVPTMGDHFAITHREIQSN